jgi:hypothetical protein
MSTLLTAEMGRDRSIVRTHLRRLEEKGVIMRDLAGVYNVARQDEPE